MGRYIIGCPGSIEAVGMWLYYVVVGMCRFFLSAILVEIVFGGKNGVKVKLCQRKIMTFCDICR